jgi:hypothetical protein
VAAASAAAVAAGIYCSGYDTHLNARNGFPVFSTHIEANYVSKATDAWNVYKLTDEDRQEILKMANDPTISERCCCCGCCCGCCLCLVVRLMHTHRLLNGVRVLCWCFSSMQHRSRLLHPSILTC